MANINTEKVYTVELSANEQQRLNGGNAVEIELPDDVTVKLTASGSGDVELTGTSGSNESGGEVDPDEIENLVQDSEARARENRGTDAEPPEDDDSDDDGDSGNQQQTSNGIIDIERGG